MTTPTLLLQRAADGCYHPTTEGELVSLVKYARATGSQVRVMGSTHSVWKAVVTDGFDGPRTPTTELPVVLDRYTAIFDPKPDPAKPGECTVEVQAGCHVGLSPVRALQNRFDPPPAEVDQAEGSPWHVGSWEQSLTYVLHQKGYALPDLGGISHQTVSGFISTGSQGGTVKWSVHDAIEAMRVIDGEGVVHELSMAKDPEYFRSAGIGMGLCGIISTITFRGSPRFDIVGSETVSATKQSTQIDFYGDRAGSNLPSLEKYLCETDYSRLMWWPQRNFDRLVVWEASRSAFDPNRVIKPYREIAHFPVLSQVAASVVYTVLGNLETPDRAVEQLKALRQKHAFDFKQVGTWLRKFFTPQPDPDFPMEPQHAHPYLSALIELVKGERHSPVTLGAAWVLVAELLTVAADDVLVAVVKAPLLKDLFAKLGPLVEAHLDTLLGIFVTSGKDGAPVTQTFADRWFTGLPMDNQMDDLLIPTWFTELWVPFTPGDGKVQQTISTLRRLFDADGTPHGCYQATGAFAFELYMGKAEERFWLSPAAGTQNVFRVDVFWFGRNASDPVQGFYQQFWNALEPLGYRCHWGKFLPPPDPARPDRLTRRYPDFMKWKAVRERADPGNVFLTKYWKAQLGL